MPVEDIDVSLLRKLIAYDFKNGILFWKHRETSTFCDGHRSKEHVAKIWNAKYAGKPALMAINSAGYRSGSILSERCVAHRVAWALFYGAWPEMQIDHVNRIKTDNRIINLRDVSNSQNQRNVGTRKTNSSGVLGVSYHKKSGKWAARIGVSSKIKNLGLYETIEKAAEARRIAEGQYGYIGS